MRLCVKLRFTTLRRKSLQFMKRPGRKSWYAESGRGRECIRTWQSTNSLNSSPYSISVSTTNGKIFDDTAPFHYLNSAFSTSATFPLLTSQSTWRVGKMWRGQRSEEHTSELQSQSK